MPVSLSKGALMSVNCNNDVIILDEDQMGETNSITLIIDSKPQTWAWQSWLKIRWLRHRTWRKTSIEELLTSLKTVDNMSEPCNRDEVEVVKADPKPIVPEYTLLRQFIMETLALT
ncbi:hypothetical protein ACH5RR_008636 [Cinchona calisaya]|uniref:Uncharacterized protein n=1 Tax=Cinchona calisaya TaxID=153742 RepID=A0ABD3ACA1_9GENT